MIYLARGFLFLLSLFHGSFVFSAEDTPLLSVAELPTRTIRHPVSDPRGIVSGSEISGGDFRGITAGGSVVFGNHITTQLINNSKFKVEYEQLTEIPSESSVYEFEHLLKVYEINNSLAPLYMMNFKDIGVGRSRVGANPISLEYYADLKTEYVRGDAFYTTMGAHSVEMARKQAGCCKNPFFTIKRQGYQECLEIYENCKGRYKAGAPHIRQIDVKIQRVNEYLSFLPPEPCCSVQ